MSSVRVDVQGLREFRRELKKLDGRFPKELRAINKRAADMIVPPARRNAGASRPNQAGGTARGGSKLVGTVRALASQSRAHVAMGGARVPWARGTEWGSSGRYRQFPARSSDGYVLYPAVKEMLPAIRAAYGDMVDQLLREAFPG